MKENKMKERRKKRYLSALHLKPKFAREFVRLSPFVLALMLALDCLFTTQAASYYKDLADYVIEEQMNHLESCPKTALAYAPVDTSIDFNWIASPQSEGEWAVLSELRNRVALPGWHTSKRNLFERMCLFRKGSRPFLSFNAVYNTDGYLLADQSPAVFLSIIKNPDADGRIEMSYRLDGERIEQKHPGLFQQIIDAGSLVTTGKQSLSFDDIYLKEADFLPKTITLWDKGEAFIANGIIQKTTSDRFVSSFDLSDCDFSGYEKIELDGSAYQSYSGSCVINPDYYGTNHHKTLYEELDEDAIKEQINEAARLPGACLSIARKTSKYQTTGVLFKCFTFNPTLVGVVAVDYDFFRDWREILLVVYGLNLALALFAALVLGWFRLQKKRLSYEVDSYRRKTTDAMAHDLKSPLMAISGYAENIASHTDDSKTDYYANAIMSVVSDMDRMIGNILDLSKLENASYAAKHTEISLRELFERQLALYEPKLCEKRLEAVIEGNSTIWADADQMRHLADNLLSNAVRYSSPDSQILIRLGVGGEISVKNTFVYELAVEPEMLLLPFVKGDTARTNTQGSGLGLSIVNQIAAAHGFSVKITVVGQFFEVQIH